MHPRCLCFEFFNGILNLLFEQFDNPTFQILHINLSTYDIIWVIIAVMILWTLELFGKINHEFSFTKRLSHNTSQLVSFWMHNGSFSSLMQMSTTNVRSTNHLRGRDKKIIKTSKKSDCATVTFPFKKFHTYSG